MQGTPDIAQLRNLLFGKGYDELLALKEQFANSDRYSASVASIIAEAISLRLQQDDALPTVLEPVVEQSITRAIHNQPKHFADVLYPVMGPAIRRSIQQALSEMLENINQLLEHSFSLRTLRWRFDAWRTGHSYAQIALLHNLVYQVEQVFLIHRDSGLLLHHLVADNAISKDPEIVSGMLTAIQDFIQDSFAINSEDTLDSLRLGELTVLVEHGPLAITALVVRGTVPGELRSLLADTSAAIHSHYAQALQAYQGDASQFAGVETLLEPCLKRQTRPQQRRRPWLAYVLLGALLATATYGLYAYYQRQAQQEDATRQMQQAVQDKLQHLQQALTEQQSRNAELETSLQDLRAQHSQTAAQQAQETAANEQQLAALAQQLDASAYPFAHAQADVDPTSPAVQQVGKTIRQLLQMAQSLHKIPQITLVGNTDASGTETINQTLAQDRATNMRKALIQTGIPAFILLAQPAYQPGTPTEAHKNERGIRYKVELY